MKQKRLAVVGAGASGMTAAIEAARISREIGSDVKITLYEKLPKVGKKILATGNGRCNILNSGSFKGRFSGDKKLINSVFERYPTEDNIAFFSSLGLMLTEEADGRLYPMSLQASSVLDALRFELENLNIEVLCDTAIEKIAIADKKFVLNDCFESDSLIIAGGGKASPVQGSDGSCYSLLSSLGIKINTVSPALTGIVLKKKNKSLKGTRAHGEIMIVDNGKVIASDCGELQYTDYGISGIPAMNVSRYVSEHFAFNKKGKIIMAVNVLPDFSYEEIFDYIIKRKKSNPELLCEDLLTGLMPKKLGIAKLHSSSIQTDKKIGALTKNEIAVLTETINSELFEISGTLGFENSQVTAGGVASSELCPNTLECKKLNGLFVCGEILDADAQCGGYNLSWAWSSGRLAGNSAINYLTEKK